MRAGWIIFFSLFFFGCVRVAEAVDYPKNSELKPVFPEVFELIRDIEKLEERTSELHKILDAQVTLGFGDEALKTVRLLANRPNSPNKPHQIKMYGTLARAHILRGDSFEKVLKIIDEGLEEAEKITKDVDQKNESIDTMFTLALGALERRNSSGTEKDEIPDLVNFSNELFVRILETEHRSRQKDRVMFTLGKILISRGEIDWHKKTRSHYDHFSNIDRVRDLAVIYHVDAFLESKEKKDYDLFQEKLKRYAGRLGESEFDYYKPAIERLTRAGEFECSDMLMNELAESEYRFYPVFENIEVDSNLYFSHILFGRFARAENLLCSHVEIMPKQCFSDRTRFFPIVLNFLLNRKNAEPSGEIVGKILVCTKIHEDERINEESRKLYKCWEKIFAFISRDGTRTEKDAAELTKVITDSQKLFFENYGRKKVLEINFVLREYLKENNYEKEADYILERLIEFVLDDRNSNLYGYIELFSEACFRQGNHIDIFDLSIELAKIAPDNVEFDEGTNYLELFPRNGGTKRFYDAFLFDLLCRHVELRMVSSREDYVKNGMPLEGYHKIDADSILKRISKIDLDMTEPCSIVSIAFLQARLGDFRVGLETLEHEKIPVMDRNFAILSILAKDHAIKRERAKLEESGKKASLELPLMDRESVEEWFEFLRLETLKDFSDDLRESEKLAHLLRALIARFETEFGKFDEAIEDIQKIGGSDEMDYRKILLEIEIYSRKFKNENPDSESVLNLIEKWNVDFLHFKEKYAFDIQGRPHYLLYSDFSPESINVRISEFKLEMLKRGILSDDPEKPFKEEFEKSASIERLLEYGWYDSALRDSILLNDPKKRRENTIETLSAISESLQREQVGGQSQRKQPSGGDLMVILKAILPSENPFDNFWKSFSLTYLEGAIKNQLLIKRQKRDDPFSNEFEISDYPFWELSSFRKGFSSETERLRGW